MKSKPKIFFSYAWGDDKEPPGESREKLVSELYNSLLAENYNPVRDKNNVKYKDFFSDFIAELGKGKCIVVAISDKYLKSTYCMFELYEIARHSNFDKYHFREKIFPIMVEFIDFNNPAIIEHYLRFWESQYKLWSDLIAKRAGQLSVEQMQRYDKVKMIYQNFGKLTDWLADINTLNPQLLSKDNFAEIKKAIIATVSPEPIPIPPIPNPWIRVWKMLTRWPALLLLVATLLIVSILFFGHVLTTEIGMDLIISQVNFRLSKQQVYTNEIRFLSLGASGLEDVHFPVGENLKTQSDDFESIVLLSVDSNSKKAGTITLDALALPGGIQIGIQTTNVTGEYRMSVMGKGLKIPLNVEGPVNIGVPPKPPLKYDYASPKLIHLISGPDQIDLDFNLSFVSKSIFSGILITDSLSLMRIDQHFDNDNNMLDTVSTILSGTLQFGSSGGQKRGIFKGQLIQFKSLQGEISTLELQGDRIAFSFHGHVSGMTTGEGDNLVSLMPTYLNWLKASHELPLLLGTTLYIVGLIFSALRWWRASL